LLSLAWFASNHR
jgi:hypothetical protein